LENENIFSLQQKMNLLDRIATMIHELSVSGETFEKTYAKYYKAIEDTRRRLDDQVAGYEHYVQEARGRYQRGQQRKVMALLGQSAPVMPVP